MSSSVTHSVTHTVSFTDRQDMKISGVREVESFDADSVVLITSCGEMTVEGRALQITVLDTDRGEVVLCGTVDGLYYTEREEKERRGLFGRMLR